MAISRRFVSTLLALIVLAMNASPVYAHAATGPMRSSVLIEIKARPKDPTPRLKCKHCTPKVKVGVRFDIPFDQLTHI